MESYSKTDIIKVLQSRQTGLFNLVDFRRLFGIFNSQTLYKKIQRLEKEKIIQKLAGGKYRFLFTPVDDFTIANFLYEPSYVSLESALSFYGIITGFSYQITSLARKKARVFRIDNKDFQYSRVSPGLFWGYEKKENFLIAEPEKALLDYLYFGLKGLRNLNFDEFDLKGIDKQKLVIDAKKLNDGRVYDYISANRKFS